MLSTSLRRVLGDSLASFPKSRTDAGWLLPPFVTV